MSAALFQHPRVLDDYSTQFLPILPVQDHTGSASSSRDPSRLFSTTRPTNKATCELNSVPVSHAIGSFENVGRSALTRRRVARSSTIILDREGQYALIGRLIKAGGRITKKQLAEVQRQYVNKPETLLFLLQKDIQELHAQVQTLKEQYQHTIGLGNMLQHVVTDYFRLVRYGYATGNLLGFLREVSAPDVMFNTEYSPEAIDQHWCLSQWFGNVEVEVESFQKSSCHSLVVATITKMTITRETLRNVFPHLRTTDNSAHNCKLVEKLLNQRLVMRGSTCFDWDRSSCCLTRVLTQNDMLTPMLNLLGNLEDVARVFNKALISPAFEWRMTPL